MSSFANFFESSDRLLATCSTEQFQHLVLTTYAHHENDPMRMSTDDVRRELRHHAHVRMRMGMPIPR